jgi:hypothetical protein
MRRTLRPLITVTLGCILALFSAALSYSAPPTVLGDFGSAVFSMQPTSTPKPDDLSEIGSTDGIVVMGVLITFIIIIPILLRRKSWLEGR